MSRDDAQMKIRLPEKLREAVEQSAAENGRSLNAEIVHMVQTYFADLGQQVQELSSSLERQQRENLSYGLKDQSDRNAALKVLLLDEVALLRKRVAHLGGKEAVLSANKAELVKRIEGPRIAGTQEERTSYFSTAIESWPLTALFTQSELDKLAGRIVAMQDAQKVAQVPYPKQGDQP